MPENQISLQEFITRTLEDIKLGVSKSADVEMVCSPSVFVSSTPQETSIARLKERSREDNGLRAMEFVDFDIAVTAESINGKEGGFGVFVLSLGAGGKASSENKLTSATKVKFRVPIAFR